MPKSLLSSTKGFLKFLSFFVLFLFIFFVFVNFAIIQKIRCKTNKRQRNLNKKKIKMKNPKVLAELSLWSLILLLLIYGTWSVWIFRSTRQHILQREGCVSEFSTCNFICKAGFDWWETERHHLAKLTGTASRAMNNFSCVFFSYYW